MKRYVMVLVSLVLFRVVVGVAAMEVEVSPGFQVASVNGAATFTAKLRGAVLPVTYLWYRDGVALDLGVNPTVDDMRLVISGVTLGDAGEYSVLVTDQVGSVMSGSVDLVVDGTFTKVTLGVLVEDVEPSTGCIWGDADGDGDLDVFVTNSGGQYPNSVYENLGGGEFRRVDTAVDDLPVRWTWSGAWADMDNDGDLDLFVMHSAGSGAYSSTRLALYRNEGDWVFVAVESVLTTTGQLWTDVALVDFDRDGVLDVFATTQAVSGGVFAGNFFFRGLGSGDFVAWTEAEVGGVLAVGSSTASAMWCDVDGDGDMDLYVSNYNGTGNYLYRNDGGRLVAVTAGSLPARRSTWGAAWVDVNGDGLFDLVTGGEYGVTSLHINRGDWFFEDATVASGLELSGSVYNFAVGDYDNDGDMDIYVPVYDGLDALFVNRGDGVFDRVDVGSPLIEAQKNSAVWVDFDGDGFLDLSMACGDLQPMKNLLFRNCLREMGNANNWIGFRLRGGISNGSALGARVIVGATIGGVEKVQVQEVTSVYGVGVNSELHFGLGDATQVDWLRVEWPSGNVFEGGPYLAGKVRELREFVGISPAHPSVSPGGSVELSARAGLGIQWYHDGVELEGETGAKLILSNVTTEAEGHYSAVVIGTSGVTTHHTYLRVDSTFTKDADSAISEREESAWGANFADVNGDGWIDLVVWNGYDAGTNQIVGVYLNEGGIYRRLAVEEGGDLVGRSGLWVGGALGDMDGDGDVDAVGSEGYGGAPAKVFINDGQGFFVTMTGDDPLVTVRSGGYPSFADYDRDGVLDVAFGSSNWGGIVDEKLFRGLGEGWFEEVPSMFPSVPGASTESIAWGDYDDDGDPDLIVCDYGRKRLRVYRNTGGHLELVTAGGLAEVTGAVLVVAFGDYDNDLRMDLFVSNYAGGSWLLHNEGGGEFSIRTLQTGPATGYAAWGDYDNDGDLDLIVATGQGNGQANVFFRNEGGWLVRCDIGSPTSELGRTGPVLFADVDNDGDLDLYEGRSYGEKDGLYLNNGNGNHWLKVALRGTVSNTSAIGARVIVRYKEDRVAKQQMRELFGGNRGQEDPRAHFGLGSCDRPVDLEVLWPSGTHQKLSGVAVDQILEVVEPRCPVLGGCVRIEGGLELEFVSEAGKEYRIQESADLVVWTTVETVAGNGDRVVIALPTSESGEGQRFYRVEMY